MATPTRGIRNNNPMNIRRGAQWQGLAKVQSDESFCVFESMTFGLRAGMKLLKNYITGNNATMVKYDTIRRIVFRWAPPTENATLKYVDYIYQTTKIHPDERLWWSHKDRIKAIARAMCFVESGYNVDDELLESAYHLV